MKQAQFIGWVKKAYPTIFRVTRENGDIWLSDGKFLQVAARTDDIIEFHKLGNRELRKPTIISDDATIVSNIRDLWGEPKVAFSGLPQEKPKTLSDDVSRDDEPDLLGKMRDFLELQEKQKSEESKREKSEPKKEQPRVKSALERDSVIDLLKKEFPDAVEITRVPGGKAVVTNGSKLTLYDYGISSKPSEFIPWAREEEVRQCVTKFITINKKHHE